MHLETMEPAAVYCVKAQTFVRAIGRHSAFSQAECVKVQGKDGLFVPWGPAQVTAPPLLTPTLPPPENARLPAGFLWFSVSHGLTDLLSEAGWVPMVKVCFTPLSL